MSYNTDPNEFKVCPYDSSHRISIYIYFFSSFIFEMYTKIFLRDYQDSRFLVSYLMSIY
jgi:hypothetical protein